MSQLRACACALGVLLLTGCTAAGAAEHVTADHATGHRAQATGHVTGRLLIEGGPIGPGGQQPGEQPIPGTVTFTAAGQRPVSVGVGASGKFSAWLPPGPYRIAGRSPDIETGTSSGQTLEQACSQPLSVTVRAQHAAAIAVVCVVP